MSKSCPFWGSDHVREYIEENKDILLILKEKEIKLEYHLIYIYSNFCTPLNHTHILKNQLNFDTRLNPTIYHPTARRAMAAADKSGAATPRKPVTGACSSNW